MEEIALLVTRDCTDSYRQKECIVPENDPFDGL